MLDKCPECGKTHVLKPKACECGYDFEKKGMKPRFFCPRDKTELKLEWSECPECKKPINELIRYLCPKCGEMVGIKDKACKCGEKLIREFFICWNCKKEVEAGTAVCPKCGIKFNINYSKCPRCGGLVEEDSPLCSHCGLKFSYEESGIVEYTCPRCGYSLPTASSSCPICDQPQYSSE